MKFLNRATRYLDGLYNFTQGILGTDDVNLTSGIQLVHALERSVELASGVGKAMGFCSVADSQVHPGAGTLTGSIDLHAQAGNLGYALGRHSLWLLDIQIIPSVAGAFTSARISTSGETLAGNNSARLLRVFTGEVASVNVFGLPTYTTHALPLLLLHEAATGVAAQRESTVGGAVTLTFNYLLWIGAIGARPPGVA